MRSYLTKNGEHKNDLFSIGMTLKVQTQAKKLCLTVESDWIVSYIPFFKSKLMKSQTLRLTF